MLDLSYVLGYCRWSGKNNLKDDPDAIDLEMLIFGQMASPSLWQGTPQRIDFTGIWNILQRRRIFHAPDTIDVHGGL